jgi:SAM-dependent methyltransferase
MTGEPQTAFRYPDPGEQLTIAMIEDGVLSPAEWEQQESDILSLFRDALRPLTRRRLLDYGSGDGRLTFQYTDLFDRVTSIEPDPERAARQSRTVDASPDRDKIEVLRSYGGIDAPRGQFDAAICSHVIQHVSAGTVDGILRDLSEALRAGGLLLLFTTLGGWRTQRFVADSFNAAGGRVEVDLSQDEFEAACRQNQLGRLPIHFFAYHSLIETLARHSLTATAAYGFHGRTGVVGPLTSPEAEARLGPDLSASRDVAVIAVNQITA